jgi:hypothetical protein
LPSLTDRMSLLFPKSRDLVRLGIAHIVPKGRLLRPQKLRVSVACALRLRQRERDGYVLAR